MSVDASPPPRPRKLSNLHYSIPEMAFPREPHAQALDHEPSTRHSSSSGMSGDGSPLDLSPWNPSASPYTKSPWTLHAPTLSPASDAPARLVGSLVREEGHIYSLAASGNLLYTGSDSKNIRVWRNQREFSGFKSSSGLVKAIVIAGDHRIFTGHQDGKIRVWRSSTRNPAVHKREGSLPRLKDYLKSSLRPSSYVEVRRHRNALWIRHYDAVSCLSISEDAGVLYSGSWDKTFKVWRVSDSRCLESVTAHDDAVNAVVAGGDGLVFTGSADGTVKAWKREAAGRKATRHVEVRTLLRQESAVTALVLAGDAWLYSGSSDGVVNFWEKRRLEHGGTLRGHALAVLCLATAGSLVLSGSADKSMCMWRREGDAGAHVWLSVLRGHQGPVKCLAVERDAEAGWVVYSGSLDKSVKVWKVADGDGRYSVASAAGVDGFPLPSGSGRQY